MNKTFSIIYAKFFLMFYCLIKGSCLEAEMKSIDFSNEKAKNSYEILQSNNPCNFKILDSKDGVTFEEINELTEKVGWGKKYYPSEEKWQRTLDVSTHIAYMKDDGKLIAFGRILEDGMMCMFYDICIHPDYQKKGIGTSLIFHLINKIKDNEYISIGLFPWEGNPTVSSFYEKCGFEPVHGMELKKYMRKFF